MKIVNHNWTILFVDRKDINNCDGLCVPSELTIKIADDIKGEYRKIVFTHELIHAIFDEHGRYFESKLSHEDLCEFIAWNFDEIQRCVDQFIREIGI